MNTKMYLIAFAASILSGVSFAATTVTLSTVTPTYQGQQAATVSATVQGQAVQFATTVRLLAQAAATTDTKAFSSATSQKDAQAYVKQTYCGASEIAAADITAANERASSKTTLHPTSVTSVFVRATQTNGTHRPKALNFSVSCAASDDEE